MLEKKVLQNVQNAQFIHTRVNLAVQLFAKLVPTDGITSFLVLWHVPTKMPLIQDAKKGNIQRKQVIFMQLLVYHVYLENIPLK